MIDSLVKSTVFGFRNADKVINTDDKGRIFADVGQFTNAIKHAAELDNKIGRGAKAAVSAMSQATKGSKILTLANKGVNWAANNVNPLLVGAAGYRVLIADDKASALKREAVGMSSMFMVEAFMKDLFKSPAYLQFKNKISNKYLKTGLSILEGIVFVCGSIAGSTAGYKIADACMSKNTKTESKVPDNKVNITKQNTVNKAEAADDYEKEFFIPGQDKEMMA